MTMLTRLTFAAIVFSLFLLPRPAKVIGQEAASAESSGESKVDVTSDEIPNLSIDEVKSVLNAINNDPDLSDEIKAKFASDIEQITEIVVQGDQFAQQTTVLKGAVDSSPKAVEENKQKLVELDHIDNPLDQISSRDATEVRSVLDAKTVSLNELTDELEQVESQLAKTQGRPVEIATRLPEAGRELTNLEKEWGSLTQEAGKSNREKNVQKLMLRARCTRLRNEIDMMNVEGVSQTARIDELESRSKLLTRKIEIAKAEINAINDLLNKQLASEVDQIRVLVDSAMQDLPGDETVQELAAEVQSFSSQFERVVRDQKRLVPASSEVSTRLTELTADFRDVRNELNLGSGGNELVQVLLELSRRARPDVLKVDVPLSVERARLEWFTVKKKLGKQSEVEREFADRNSEAVTQLVDAREEILTKYQSESGNLTRTLGAVQAKRQQYFNLCDDVHQFVSESLFGFKIRSCPRISWRAFSQMPAGVSWLFSVSHGSELLNAFALRSTEVITAMIIAALLLLLRRFFKRALAATIPPTKRTSTDSYWFTVQALIWTLLLAAPYSICVGTVSWVISQAPSPSDWMVGMTYGVGYVVTIMIISVFLYEVCRPFGVGVGHFGWDQEVAAHATSVLKSIISVYVPMMLVVASTGFGDSSEYFSSLGRLAYLFAHAWVAYVLYKKVYLNKNLSRRVDGDVSSQIVRLWKRVWGPLWIGTPIVLIAIASLGYMMTAIRLSQGLFISAAIIVAGEILVGLSIRAFEIRRRRIKLSEALKKRRLNAESSKKERTAQDSEGLLQLDEEEELGLDLSAASDQTAAFFRLLFMGSTVIVLYSYWSSVVPLTVVLDQIAFPIGEGLSLLALVKSFLVVTATVIAARNLPGLLEFTVLRGSTIEAGTRNAIYTLCQYAVIGIALIAISTILELDWEKFGWMAAALSVGLGFGLQEVLANFVCGLILLFERPIRVGDVVTLEGTTGTVSNINMRATTITNWDRQELVIPNKNLITGTILNWTLSAPLNRVVIPVGVAYGVDTERACKILLEVAADHPNVLDDPNPLASFEQFADSSLHLVLRAYLPNLDNRLGTITSLHTEIARRFAEAGIEIPYPQTDLHLRSGFDFRGNEPHHGDSGMEFVKPH